MSICLAVTVFFFFIFKTYLNLLRYSTFKDALRIFLAIFFANITLVVINKLLSVYYEHSILPKEGLFVNFILTFCFIFLSRMSVRLLFDFIRAYHKKSDNQSHIPLLIHGVGPVSISLAKMIAANEHLPYDIAGFLTSDRNAKRKEIISYPVYSQDDFFNDISKFKNIKAFLIVPNEIERAEKQIFADICAKNRIDLLSAPQAEDWKNFENIKKIKKVRIEDLLGRIPIHIDIDSIGKNLNGKNVLITGAAGSIGSEIVRQISRFKLNLLIICDVAESPLHNLGLELEDKYPNMPFVQVIADVKNYNQMKCVFDEYKPQYIYHAAAYKHVPLMEKHPCEAVLTNVLGSRNIIDLAVLYKSETFVMVSTDKAVNPSNIMGATKRIAEMYVQSLHRKIIQQSPNAPTTRIITTRFGNVLGSNGSVIPRFYDQIKAGGPVTVTDREIIRFFMTIPEACRLVLEAGNFGKGGEVFVFDMGDPIRITDMAEKMIRLSGFEPYKDIEIKFTGLRPGEKLHEELLYDKEKVIPTNNRKIKIGIVPEYDYNEVVSILTPLIETANNFNKIETVKLMKRLVPEFISQNSEYEELDNNELINK
ncbi:MAG: polysaccharide biosynthesis protein [Dysgonamonadaceae bacterium]|jgi:FlaA1/EpsC-like NDP-sugar epimerase|nr:polysaccharide biosynthesis protein [Dysgonamonadaceae bacterium]